VRACIHLRVHMSVYLRYVPCIAFTRYFPQYPKNKYIESNCQSYNSIVTQAVFRICITHPSLH